MLRLVWLVPVFAVVAGGCSLPGPVADRSTYFTLTPDVASDGPAPESLDITVGLGPVTLPGYLDRAQLVRRTNPNQLELAGSARWAEPLRESIVRILQQDLLAASGARAVTRYPWLAASGVDVVVAVDVLRFEAGEDREAELVARWSVRELAPARVVAVQESYLTEQVEGSGTAAEVAALSRTLGGLAREIAVALQGMHAKPRTGARRKRP